ncbi:hypothetical protein Hypma_002976 [Hypsizygus marmoreus]|uniref:Uncharacterized protein n=1 Tax=Hypsizygus marmoreus TaxID=39966 RepID=A0A369J2Z7_HYPMA|nr:hypothetical protein Hypma_002976 [Hypsizygus marmoreus]
MKNSGLAPSKAVIPSKIEREGLFKLDVDDDIWQDIGLDDDNLNGVIPAWLGDENTRKGIKAMLELDRCVEEEQRLAMERCTLQEWLLEEWNSLLAALEICEDIDITYQLEQRKTYLCHLCAIWEQKTRPLATQYDMPNTWGPSEAEIHEAIKLDQNASWDYDDSEDINDSDYDSEIDGEDEELLEAFELSTLADAYRNEEILSVESLFPASKGNEIEVMSLLMSGTPGLSRSKSPRKRNRRDDDDL